MVLGELLTLKLFGRSKRRPAKFLILHTYHVVPSGSSSHSRAPDLPSRETEYIPEVFRHVDPTPCVLVESRHLAGVLTDGSRLEADQTCHWRLVCRVGRDTIDNLRNFTLTAWNSAGSNSKAPVTRWCYPSAGIAGELSTYTWAGARKKDMLGQKADTF